jgi:uncharacterized lipoprotein YehR (DUF1307 family)
MEAIGAQTKEDARKAKDKKTNAYQDCATAPTAREFDEDAANQVDEDDNDTDLSAVKYAITKVQSSLLLGYSPSLTSL